MTHICKKDHTEDLGNYRPVRLTSVPGKVMEQIILRVIMWHVWDDQGIRPTQHGFVKDEEETQGRLYSSLQLPKRRLW